MRRLRLWVLPLATAKRLGLGERLVPVPDQLDEVAKVYHEKRCEKPTRMLTGRNMWGAGVYHGAYF